MASTAAPLRCPLRSLPFRRLLQPLAMPPLRTLGKAPEKCEVYTCDSWSNSERPVHVDVSLPCLLRATRQRMICCCRADGMSGYSRHQAQTRSARCREAIHHPVLAVHVRRFSPRRMLVASSRFLNAVGRLKFVRSSGISRTAAVMTKSKLSQVLDSA